MYRSKTQPEPPQTGKIAGLVAVIVVAVVALVFFATRPGPQRVPLEVPAAHEAENNRDDHVGGKGALEPRPGQVQTPGADHTADSGAAAH